MNSHISSLDALTADDIAALNQARDRGLVAAGQVAERYYPGDAAKAARGADYLREKK